MEHLTYIKYIRTSPKKLRFIIDDVKTMKPVQAVQVLNYDNRRVSKVLYKVIKCAIDGAKTTLKMNENLLQFKVLTVEEGPAIKRSRAGGRGTPKLFKRRTSHVKIILEGFEPTVATPKKEEEKEVIVTEKKTVKKTSPKSVEKTVVKNSRRKAA